jgi:pyruvate,water dikinase
MGLLRYALLEAGRRLGDAGVLAASADVWFLRRDELEEALAGSIPADLGTRAAERKVAHERRTLMHPPSRFGTPPEGFPPRPAGLAPEAQRALEASAWSEGLGRRQRGAGGDAPNELRGRGASRGTYSGPARIVLREADFDKVQHGDVLVSKFTMPSWNVILTRVRAIVTDEGGIMSHAAIVAREFGIPAVVGTRDATAKLKDGQTVHVDGATGVVRF